MMQSDIGVFHKVLDERAKKRKRGTKKQRQLSHTSNYMADLEIYEANTKIKNKI